MSQVTVGDALKLVQILAELGKAAIERKAARSVDTMSVEQVRKHALELQGRIKPWDSAEDDDGA